MYLYAYLYSSFGADLTKKPEAATKYTALFSTSLTIRTCVMAEVDRAHKSTSDLLKIIRCILPYFISHIKSHQVTLSV